MHAAISPEKMPDPWLYDTAALIADLDHVRELINAIPLTMQGFGRVNAATAAVWELRERIRWLVRLRSEAQERWQARTTNDFEGRGDNTAGADVVKAHITPRPSPKQSSKKQPGHHPGRRKRLAA